MSRLERLPIEEQNVHVSQGQQFEIGIAVSNAAQLIRLEPEKVAYLTAKHGQRVEAMFTEAPTIGVLLNTPNSSNPEVAAVEERGVELAREQITYMRDLSGGRYNLQAFTETDLKNELENRKRAVLTPYANNDPFQQSFERMGLSEYEVHVSGVPTVIVEEIKGKKKFHERVSELKDAQFAVPHHDFAKVNQVVETANMMLEFEEELYQAVGLPGYVRGVVLRPDYSDGGYGTCMVYEKNGRIIVSNDEQAEKEDFDTWNKALEAAQQYLKKATKNDPEADIVVSRFMQVPETPGLSIFFLGDEDNNIETVSLGFNGQIQHPSTKACIGTETYQAKDEELATAYQSIIADKAKNFILNLMSEKGIKAKDIRGPINFDVMFLGEDEQFLQREITRLLRDHPQSLSASLKDKLIKYKQLEKPASYFLAESNPRSTNYTGAIYAALTAEGKPHTIKNMRDIIKEGIRTGDTIQVPEGVDINAFRNELLERFRPEVRNSGLIIMKTAPVEVAGKSPNGHGREMSAIFTKQQNEQKLIPIFQQTGARAA